MPTTPSQVAVTIQVMFDIGIGTPGAVDAASQALASMNQGSPLTIASNYAQLAATVVSVGAAVGFVGPWVVIGTSTVAATITIAKELNDVSSGGAVSPLNLGDIWAVLGNVASIAGAGIPGSQVAALGFSIVGGVFGAAGIIENQVKGGVSSLVTDLITAAQNYVIPRRDPLVLDLDGDGLELVSANGTVLFDHNADGIKTGTGWAAPNDGLLVRDLNGNGLIDSGRELFGIDTIKSNNTFATQGFDALKDLDSNLDGFITSADAAFAELKVWQDLNQDGISQAGELKTLSQWGITNISATGSATGPQAGQVLNGNRVDLSATFTQNGAARTVGSVDFQINNFFTQFPAQVVDEAGNPVAITAQAQALPQMNGSGMVRNMQAAASLSGDFATALQTFTSATTRDAQRSQLDDLITKWADTSTFENSLLASGASITYNLPAGVTVAQYKNLIHVLEAFNGTHFYGNAQGGPRPAGFAMTSSTNQTTGVISYAYIVSPPADQVALLQQAYDALKESVYSALVVQTRLAPYLDSIELVVDASGVHFDASLAIAMAQSQAASAPSTAVGDLIDLHKYAADTVKAVGWEPYQTLEDVLESTTITPDIQNILTAERIVSLGVLGVNFTVVNPAGWTVLGNSGANALIGGSGADVLHGGAGNDTLLAVGNGDVLEGGDGDDVLAVTGTLWVSGTTFTGGKGNDAITGAYVNNTYVFNAGDGQDTIVNYNGGAAGCTDVLRFGAGIAPADVRVQRVGLDMVFSLAGSSDQITVKNWFSEALGYSQIEQVRFADGTVWTSSALTTQALEVFGTSGADALTGVNAFVDVLHGGAGNDTLLAVGNGDVLEGGDGDDVLAVTGTLWVSGTTFTGGKGNDAITGAYVNNTYVFNAGDGQDTIVNYNGGAAGCTDVLRFGAGIAPADVRVQRVGLDMVFSLAGSSDQITVKNWFSEALGYSQIEQVRFADGTVWDAIRISASVLMDVLGSAAHDTLTGSTGSDNILASDGNDTLYGLAGHDRLDGGSGSDIMIGGIGDDVYYVDTIGDVVVENLNEGTDTVYTAITYTVGINVENLILTGSLAINGTGNSLNNMLTGNSAANILAGGAGDDTYFVSTGDTVTEASNAGTDSVFSNVTWTLSANVENLTLVDNNAINGTGNTLNNVITGNNAANTLNGGGGADTLLGGAGNDIYVVDNVGDVVTEYLGAGSDLVQSSITYALSANVENLTLTGSAVINGTGNELANLLTGNSANNLLTGGAGDDTLNGGTGDDTMLGGLGNDIFVVNVATDIVTENANEGTDMVQSVITWTLGANVENLTLTGSAAVNGTGNALDNVLVGNSGANTLTGGAGNDRLDGGTGNDLMIGGAGDDVYVVNIATDVVTELANEGVDTVLSSATLTLGANVENLTLTGSSALNGIGNSMNNWLIGNSGANVLTGGLGADTLTGSAGADTFVLSTLGDSGIGVGARDIITDFVSGTDKISFTGIDANTGVTGDQAFTMINTAAFSGVAGQLRYSQAGGNTVMEGDVNGDMLADFQLQLTGNQTFVASSYLL
jgi:trimeric autotransporter adhesin